MRNKNIFVMHNLDDFLASRADLEYLEGVLGDRLKLYPYGGHLGNLWCPQNRRDIVSVFRPLLRPGESQPTMPSGLLYSSLHPAGLAGACVPERG